MSETVRFPIEGMTCASCVSRITRTIRKLDGVEFVRVRLGSESATVGFDPGRTSLAAVGTAVGQAGYTARLELAEPIEPRAPRGLLARFGPRRS